jgi:glycosyltransferase involved in cell wall biosynthesis
VTYWYFQRQISFYTVSWPLFRWLAEHIADYNLVHIHALFSFPSTAAAFWAKRHGVPYIVRPLGVLNSWGIQNRRRFLKRLSLPIIEGRILANAAVVHLTSEQERSEADAFLYGARSVVIPNPVTNRVEVNHKFGRTLRSKYAELGEKQIILFLSRLDPIKGIDLLLSAFAKTRSVYPNVALVVAGTGDNQFLSRLHEQSRLLGIKNDVIWTGFLEGEEKQAAFDCANAFVLPSYSESFGVAVVEAMARGLPVIVSDRVAIHCEIRAAHAGLVVPCDSDSLAQAMLTMLADGKRRSEMARNAVFLAKRFSPDRVSETLTELYQSVAADASAVKDVRIHASAQS